MKKDNSTLWMWQTAITIFCLSMWIVIHFTSKARERLPSSQREPLLALETQTESASLRGVSENALVPALTAPSIDDKQSAEELLIQLRAAYRRGDKPGAERLLEALFRKGEESCIPALREVLAAETFYKSEENYWRALRRVVSKTITLNQFPLLASAFADLADSDRPLRRNCR